MKMTGISGRSAATRFWSSSPLTSRSTTSMIRQLGTRAGERARKSPPDANVSACHGLLSQCLQRFAHGAVVVDDENNRCVLHRSHVVLLASRQANIGE